MASNRKTFLSGLAVAALTPAAVRATAAPSPSPSSEPQMPFKFDHARFDRTLVTRAHRKHLVASAKTDYGRVIDVASTIYDSYYHDVGAADGSVLVCAVLYHGASVAMALNDTAWDAYVRPAMFGIKEAEIRDDLATAMPSKRGNPFGEALHELAQNRTPVFVCRWAFGGMAQAIAHVNGKPPLEVYRTLSASLVPSAMLVPSGVWAIAEVQSRGFTYQQATL